MTHEQSQVIIALAGAVAVLTPEERPAGATTAAIPWILVDELRTMLVASGFNLERARAVATAYEGRI